MGKKQYVVESQFEDLHGNPAEEPDLELDVSDVDNPIIQAALSGADENWTPPEDDEKEVKDEKPDEDDEDDVELEDDESDTKDEDEDEGDDDDEEDTDEDEEEDDKYSKSVQRRIDRERELRKKEKAEYDAKMRKMERKLELREAKDEFRDFERKTDSQLRKLRKQKVEAMEEDETSRAAEIDEEILDLKVELRGKQDEIQKLEKDIDVDTGPTSSNVPEAGQKWLGKYPEFYSNDSFRDVVLDADKMVARRGFDKNTDKYYAEIEKIIAVQFPEIVKLRTVKVRNKRKKKPAVGGTQKPGTRQKPTNSRRKGVIRLTKADQEQMLNFGLDPKNPVHAKEWAANKTD